MSKATEFKSMMKELIDHKSIEFASDRSVGKDYTFVFQLVKPKFKNYYNRNNGTYQLIFLYETTSSLISIN